jgi:hypothetical protein|uniref:Uncharacterized protein n=1 Tax=viral metagenome TaxID=1070528 RepID=A0A6C0IKX3_9ZZZZ
MTDTFFNICRHVIKNPDINIDVRVFKLNTITDDTEHCNSSWFYSKFMRNCMYKMNEYKELRKQIGFGGLDKIPLGLHEYSKIKLQCFEKLVEPPDNPFISYPENSFFADNQPITEELVQIYMKCQRHYHAFVRFANIIRYRNSNVKNQSDLMMTPISENDKSVYPIVNGSTKYLFRVYELRQIIVSCIGHTEDYFPKLLMLKNPYNNDRLQDHHLYNFYFYLKTNNYPVDELFHGYFLSEFSDEEYIQKYEILIRDRAIENAVKTSDHDKLYFMTLRMLQYYTKAVHPIKISCGFPKKKLVEIMRPYLLLFYYQLYYAQDFPKRYDSEEELRKKLSQLAIYNSRFGQRTVVRTNEDTSISTIRYNCGTPNFYKCFHNSMRNREDEYICIPPHQDRYYTKMRKIIQSRNRQSFTPTRDIRGYEDEDDYEFYVSSYFRPIGRRRGPTLLSSFLNDNDTEVDTDDNDSSIDTSEHDTDSEETPSISEPNVSQNMEANELVTNSDIEPRQVVPFPLAPFSQTTTENEEQSSMFVSAVNNTLHQQLFNLYNGDNSQRFIHQLPIETNILGQPDFIRHLLSSQVNQLPYVSGIVRDISEEEHINPIHESGDVQVSGVSIQSIDRENNSEDESSDSDDENDVTANITTLNVNEVLPVDDEETRFDFGDTEVSPTETNTSVTCGDCIVKAYTGSKDAGYNLVITHSFNTKESAERFYSSLSLVWYTRKEIDYTTQTTISETTLNVTEVDNVSNTETNTTEINEEGSDNDMNIQTNGTLHETPVNNVNDTNNEEDEEEDENEDELVASSLLTYGVAPGADEYLKMRFEEMRRDEYLSRGFTEEQYEETKDECEYGSDGEEGF